MASLNELARQRKAVLRAILGRVKTADQKIQTTQQVLRRLLGRKRLVPEAAEYKLVVESLQIADQALNETVNAVQQGLTVFNG